MNDLLYIDRTTCAGCAACVDTCPTGAISMEKDGVAAINEALCTECLACLDECPTGAIHLAESSELVPAWAREGIAVEEIIEGKVIPAPAARPLALARQPGRLVTLAGTALTFVGNRLLPRAADALVGAVERRLMRGTSPVSSATSFRSENGAPMRSSSHVGSNRGHQRRRRRGK